MPFVDRLKTFVQRIVAKIQCEVVDPTSKATLLIQVENTSVLILTVKSPQTLKTMLMIQRPTTLDDTIQCVVNYDMIESQVNFTNSNFPSTRNPTERSNNFKSNQIRTSPNTFRSQAHPVALPLQNRYQFFPSQPIQSKPVNRHYPTNVQVFGQSRPLLPSKRQDYPTPMSTSTAGPSSRLQQQKQPSLRYQNHFVPIGPRNFISQELTNVEVHSHSTIEPDQTLDENYPNDLILPTIWTIQRKLTIITRNSNVLNVDNTVANINDFDLSDYCLNQRYLEEDNNPVQNPIQEPSQELIQNDIASDSTVHSNNDPEGKRLPIFELPLNHASN
ncbi:hypothetical protein ABEB36_009422 [Hypothenemus hampei]|uniref:Uncharacterized protein n=1 Tax=Hypothenemus hampei TaxID=57062 RepID=A0ABD1EGA4_HYPHA